MIGDKGVGGTAVIGRIAFGLWATEGSDPIGFEGGFEVESILEGLNLTKTRIFAGSNPGPATIVNLYRS